MEIEEAALKKENDRLSQDRLVELQKEMAELRDEFNGRKAHWNNEKASVEKLSKLREQIEDMNRYFYNLAKERGKLITASSNVHYNNEEDYKIRSILLYGSGNVFRENQYKTDN